LPINYDEESAPITELAPNHRNIVVGKERQALPSVLTFKEKQKLKNLIEDEVKQYEN